MRKIFEAIICIAEEIKNKDNKILELEKRLNALSIENKNKDNTISRLEEEINNLRLEKLQNPYPYPLQPNPNTTPWTIPSTMPDPSWPPYGPIITYVSESGTNGFPPIFDITKCC